MKPFCPEDILLHRTVAALGGGTAHGQVVFTVTRAVEDTNSYKTVVWGVGTSEQDAGARALTSDLFNAGSPVLDPDGRRLAFLSARNGGSRQVQLLALEGGEARQLTRSRRGLQGILQWSPEGSRLLLTARVPWAEDEHDDPDAGQDRPLVVTWLPYKLDGSGPQVGHRTVLLEVDVETGEERVLVQGDFDVAEACWSPDGRQLAFVRNHSGTQRHLQDLWLADADGGNARQATRELVIVAGVRWSPDGRSLAMGGSRREGDSLSHLWLLEVESGRLSRPAGEEQLEGNVIVWHPDGDRLATIVARSGLLEITVLEPATGSIHRLEDGLRHVKGLCANGNRLAFVAVTMRCPHEVYSVGWDGQDERRHTSFNREWFAERARPRVDKRGFQVPDGNGSTAEVEGWVLLPAEGEGPFPLLVDFHGGPQSCVLIDYASHAYWYELCSRGWAILAANAVGSGSYGTAFARGMCGRWGELDLPQHLCMIEQLQDEGVASDHVACTGQSYGGYLSAWAIGQTKVFRAAVIAAPIADIESHTGTSDTGYYVGPYAMDGEITEVRERYHALSPIEYCHGVEAATLLLQGQDDQRCPLGQAEELFANLVRCSKAKAKMVVYPGGDHQLASSGTPAHRLDYHHRLADWVRTHT